VAACPTSARHFGDLGDPGSAVSKLVAGRGGCDPMPEMGYRPVSKYLPPRSMRSTRASRERREPEPTAANGLLQWIDRVLSR
jgi:Fe-S-cluster-containing dehydrogenase component